VKAVTPRLPARDRFFACRHGRLSPGG